MTGRRRPPLVSLSLWLHGLAPAAALAWPGAWPWALAAVLADHLLLVAASLTPRGTWVGANLRRLPAADGAVGLTFDDGPDPDATPAVLEILDQRGARASFFCVGRRAEQSPGLVAEIARRGHRVENHSYLHSNGFCFFPPARAACDLEQAQQVLAREAGSLPRYFRAPAGLRNPWLDGVLARRGLALASWTRRGYDRACGDPEVVLRRLTRNLAAGDVLLLHDGGSRRNAAGRPVVLAVLPALLDELDRRGLRAIPLPVPALADAGSPQAAGS